MNTSWLRRASHTAQQNSPAILSGIAIAGVIGTVVLAVKATPKACAAVVEVENEDDPLSRKEIIKVAWKFYIPAALTGTATIGCIIGANAIGARRQAALIGAYSLVDTAFRQYKDEVIEQIGEAKERKIHDKVVEKQLDANPPSSQVVILGRGEVLCYDTLTGRYFKSDHESIRRAENEVNRTVITDMYASQNEFYNLLGLPTVAIGDELGWNIEHLMELVFTTHLSEECGQPTLAVGYKHLPVKDYGRVF